LLEAYTEDDDYIVWSGISYIFEKLLKVLAVVNLEDSVKHFGKYIYARTFERIGFTFHSDDGEFMLSNTYK
jgi:hypothetical protein